MSKNINIDPTTGQISGANFDAEMDLASSLDPRSAAFREAVKLTPATLAHYRTNGKWVPAPHLRQISAILAHELSAGDAKIIIEAPPRHGKSELLSYHTPVWFLEKYPWAEIIACTHTADLAESFGRRVRDSFLEDDIPGIGQGILDTVIRKDVQRTDYFMTTQKGSMTSAGIRGSITGRGAHLLLIDDYIKNWVEASNPSTMDDIWNWFVSTAFTRLEPGGSCVVLATRWPGKDLIHRLKEMDVNKEWTVITFAAIAGENDPLGREIGAPLWPERFSLKKLNVIKNTIGSFLFESLYQQRPSLLKNTDLDTSKIRILDEMPPASAKYRWVRSWDLAGTADSTRSKKQKTLRKGPDWSVGSLVGTAGRAGSTFAQTFIADMVRERLEPGLLEDKLLETALADGHEVPILIEQEPGASGKAFAQHLATNVLRGFRVFIKPAQVNKWIRAQPYIASISHGRVSLLNAAWNKVHLEELQSFPNAEHDDTVDSVTQAYNHLHLIDLKSPVWGRQINATETDTESSTDVNVEDETSTNLKWQPDSRFNPNFRIRPKSSRVITGVVFGRKRR